MADIVANRVRIVNNTTGPKTVRHHEHLCQEHHTTTPPAGSHPSSPHQCGISPSQSGFFFLMPSKFIRTTSYWKTSTTGSAKCFSLTMTSLSPLLFHTMALPAPSKLWLTWDLYNHLNATGWPQERIIFLLMLRYVAIVWPGLYMFKFKSSMSVFESFVLL